MKNLLDFDISEVFRNEKFIGFGNILDIKKTEEGDIFIFDDQEVLIKKIGNSVLKFTINPSSIRQDLQVPHKEPTGDLDAKNYEISLPKKGQKFQMTIKNKEWTVFSPYAPDHQLGFINLVDELFEMFCQDENRNFTRISFRIPTHYGIYGLGETFCTLNKRGRVIYTFPSDNYCLGARQVYKGIPFIITNAGLGIVFPHYEPIKFDIGETMDGLIMITVPARSVTFYILLGTPREIISTFVDMFGEHPLPPPWSFGIWWSRWAGIGPQNLKEVKDYVEKFNKYRIPLDVIVLDPQWLKDYVPGVTQACSFDWDRDKFPTDNEVGNYLESEGKKLVLWINPYLEFKGTGYEKLKDCLLKNERGEVALVPNQDKNPEKPDRGMVDFTRDECREIWTGLVTDLLKRSNAQGVMSDFGETVPLDAIAGDNIPGYMLRNKLGDLYQIAAFEGVRNATGIGLIWGRSGSLRSLNLPVKWGGDSCSTWEGLKTAIRGALSASVSGALFSAFDVGGFAGKPSKELFLRWTAAAVLCPFFKLHGTTEREPWAYDDDTVASFRELVELRYSLLPYILSEAENSVKNKVPLCRPIIMDYPNDLNAINIDDEFLFGSKILVAPIMSEDGRRMIYLPEGEWVYYYDNKVYQGGQWILKEESLNRVPFFIKRGETIEFLEGHGNNVETYLALPRIKKSY